MPTTAMPIDGQTYPARDWRNAVNGAIVLHRNPAGDGIDKGVLSGGNASVTGRSVALDATVFVQRTSTDATNGVYLGYTEPSTLTLDVPDATYDRIDLILVQVTDGNVQSPATTGTKLQVVKGTPSANPTPPTYVPGTTANNEFVPLYTARVAVNGTVTLTDRRVYTTSIGGVLPWNDSAGSLPDPATYKLGQLLWQMADLKLYVCAQPDGKNAWVEMPNARGVQDLINNTVDPLKARVTNLEADSGWVAAPTLANGWTAVAGHPLMVRRVGNMRYLRGMAQQATAANISAYIFQLEAVDTPTSNQWLSVGVSSGGIAFQSMISTNGQVSLPNGYRTSTPTTTQAVPITGSWMVG